MLNGGTGADNPASARENLSLSFFTDTLVTEGMDEVPYAWINERLNTTNSISAGFENVAAGAYTSAFGYQNESAGNFSHTQTALMKPPAPAPLRKARAPYLQEQPHTLKALVRQPPRPPRTQKGSEPRPVACFRMLRTAIQ